MVRYSETQKADALKLVNEIGAVKAQEQLSISLPTLYKWKSEAKKQANDSIGKTAEKKATKKPAKQAINDGTVLGLIASNDDVTETIEALQRENIRLMSENSNLRTSNQKLREALSIFVK